MKKALFARTVQSNKGFSIILVILIVAGLLFAGKVAYEFYKGFKSQVGQGEVSLPVGGFGSQEVAVKNINSKYKIVTSKPSGWFISGQEADILLSGIDFNNSGGPLLFNHPGTVATDSIHLLLADRFNNRVLIWNKLPAGNTPPDLVLGQKDFTSNNPGTGADQMNWPVQVSVGGGKLVVADTNNDRVLIWNSFPTRNGQPADLVITARNLIWPWGVWTDGTRLVTSSTRGGVVLIWNNFPIRNDQPANLYLTAAGKFGTPRTITSDGRYLLIGDHNAKTIPGGPFFGGQGIGNFVWKTFPTKNDVPYDYYLSVPKETGGTWYQGDFTQDGKLVMLGGTLDIWDGFPQNQDTQPNLKVGHMGFPQDFGGDGFGFFGGDASGVAVSGHRLYVSLYNDNKIVGFNSIPTNSSQQPDFVIGSPDIKTNTLDTNFIMSNPVVATDGKSLFISSDFDSRLYVFQNLPDESGAKPDFVYYFPPPGPWDNELFGNTLALSGGQNVWIWNNLPRNGEKPDKIFQNTIGEVLFQDLKGVALDAKYFYLSDEKANKVYVFRGIPHDNSNPIFTLSIDSPARLSSDGNYLAVVSTFKSTVSIFKIADLSANTKPAVLGGPARFNLPQNVLVSSGHLFIADTNNNKVLIWKHIEDAIAGKEAAVVLGGNKTPRIGKNTLFWPGSLTFDGSFLWVGEYKFSERLLRFSVF
ncbi:hypothetical protein HYZ05_01335 [Candidatus Daviesbacteria bacterium]|nr:hypothetical protein [Candidatus Daviesbacteria bacterium]